MSNGYLKFLFYCCLFLGTLHTSFAKCDHSTNGRNISSKFRITINNEPETFIPKAIYTVGIESEYGFYFNAFNLTSQTVDDTKKGANFSFDVGGWFALMPEDNSIQFCQECVNTVIETSNSPKQSIHVFWIAPQNVNCVTFRVVLNVGTDTSDPCIFTIKRQFCQFKEPDPTSSYAFTSVCCPCEEVSYSLTIKGIWSKETHPKDYPPELFLTHFSDFIGAAHSENLRFFEEGQFATEGFKQLAEFGSTSVLEAELREKSDQWRSIIKASGLWYPKITSNTTTKFVVDREHSYLSIAAMIGPSPDWVVGVSKLNLCSANCKWEDSITVELIAYDAGTDSGTSYVSPNSPTIPQERIHRVTNHYPEDPRTPFYNPSGTPLSPFGKLYLHKEEVTKDNCLEKYNVTENIEDKYKAECAVTNYTNWTPCSVSCGKGMMMKSRKYVDEKKASKANCNRRLVLKQPCVGKDVTCSNEREDNSIAYFENCNTTKWSAWSDCSVSCGIGFMTRTRRFIKHSGYKLCPHVQLVEKKKCMEPSCKITVTEEKSVCNVTEWTDWSPCVTTCGVGTRVRIRHLLVSPEQYEFCLKNVTLEERKKCYDTSGCNFTETDNPKEVCSLPLEVGPCRGSYKRWYYEQKTKKCSEFFYGGCRGNKNNFITSDICKKICSS